MDAVARAERLAMAHEARHLKGEARDARRAGDWERAGTLDHKAADAARAAGNEREARKLEHRAFGEELRAKIEYRAKEEAERVKPQGGDCNKPFHDPHCDEFGGPIRPRGANLLASHGGRPAKLDGKTPHGGSFDRRGEVPEEAKPFYARKDQDPHDSDFRGRIK